jgi:hypothetical protein
MGDHDAKNGSGPDPLDHAGAGSQPNADTDQGATFSKLIDSDAVQVSDGPSDETRAMLQPEDSSRIHASVTRSEQDGDNDSVGVPSMFSTGLNVCWETSYNGPLGHE